MAYPLIQVGVPNTQNSQSSAWADYPATVYAGGTILAYCLDRANSSNPTPPAGWTTLVDYYISSAAGKLFIFSKDTVLGSETGQVEFPLGSSNRKIGIMIASDASGIDVLGSGQDSQAISTVTHEQIVTTRPECVILDTLFNLGVDNPSVDDYVPSGTELFEVIHNATNSLYIGTGTTQQAVAGQSAPSRISERTAGTETLGGFTLALYKNLTGPNISDVTVNGDTITVTLTETTNIGVGGSGGLSLDMSGGLVTATYVSGAGSNTLVFTSSRTITNGETGTASYVQPVDGFEGLSGQDVSTVAGLSVTNTTPVAVVNVGYRTEVLYIDYLNTTVIPDRSDWVVTVKDGVNAPFDLSGQSSVSGVITLDNDLLGSVGNIREFLIVNDFTGMFYRVSAGQLIDLDA